MSDYLKEGFFVVVWSGLSEPGVPEADQSIVRAAGEDRGMELVPGYVFDGCAVVQDLKDRQVLPVFLPILFDIPDADAFVRKTRQQKVLVDRVPA